MTSCSILAMAFIGMFSLGPLLTSTPATEVVGYWAVIVVAVILLPVPVIAAQMVSRERETGTLDCLLATPLPTEEIFRNKWQASTLGTARAFAILAGILFLTVLLGVIHPLAYLMLVVSWLVYGALLAGLGLFFSTFIRSARIATLFSVLFVLALGVGSEYEAPVPAEQIHDLKGWVLCVLKDMVSPLTTMKILAFNSERIPSNLREIQVAILAVLFAGLLALGVWKLTLYEFRRTTRKD
jgi:ABC-2 type transport system permease protein